MISMKAVVAVASIVSRLWGCDTLATLTAPDFARLRAAGFGWRAGYIDHVTPAELEAQLVAGIAFAPVTYALELDAAHILARLELLGIPKGVTVWLDIERIKDALDKTDITARVNACSKALVAAGYQAGVYVGAGCPLNESELFALPFVTRYWHSCSDVPRVANRGYCMHQHRPNDIIVEGEDIDGDTVEPDYKGGLPVFAVAA
jgi:hypothetical protein